MEQYRKKRRRQAWLALGTLSLLWEIPAGLRCAITRPLISGWEIYDLVHSKWTYTKIGTIQRRLAWPLRKDDTQNREAFHIFHTPFSSPKSTLPVTTTTQCDGWCHRVHSLSILPDTPRVSYTIGPQIDRRLTSGDMWLSGCFISSLANWSTSLTVQQWREDRVVTTEYTMTGDHCKIIQSSRRGLIDVRGDKKEAAAMYIVSKISCIGSWWCTTTVSSDDIVLVSN